MGSLLTKVKTKMSIHATRKVQGLLEGEYGSVFKGRSMDFDDLRSYAAGDDVKDIDWKATARNKLPLVKRYIAIRKHNVLLVVDTGRNMAARSAAGDTKRDVAVMTAGVMGHIAQKHGDLVALVAGDEESTHYLPLKGDSSHLERLLQHIDAHARPEAPNSNLSRQLEYIARTIRRRMILVIIADDLAIDASHDPLLRRIIAQHEVLWVTVGDATLTDKRYHHTAMFDIATDKELPAFIRHSQALAQEFTDATIERRQNFARMLERLAISNERVEGEADVTPKLFSLLERQRYARHKR